MDDTDNRLLRAGFRNRTFHRTRCDSHNGKSEYSDMYGDYSSYSEEFDELSDAGEDDEEENESEAEEE